MMTGQWSKKSLNAQIIFWLLSFFLLLAVAYCAFFVDGFQQQMGNEGLLLEEGTTAIFLFRSYCLLSFIKEYKKSNKSCNKRL